MSTNYDLCIDLSAASLRAVDLDDYLSRIVQTSGTMGLITVALGPDTQPTVPPAGTQMDMQPGVPAGVMLARAVDRARTRRQHLAVLLGPLVPGRDALSLMLRGLDSDPMFASAQPRFVDAKTDGVWALPGALQSETPPSSSSHAAVELLPSSVIVPELVAACMVLRWSALVAVDVVDRGYAGAVGLLLDLLTQARRRGMRGVVMNRALVKSDRAYRVLYPMAASNDLGHVQAAYPDIDVAQQELANLPVHRLEPLLSAAHPRSGPRRILLDCRGMPPAHNGSSQCIHGFLDGFAALDCADQIDVVAWPEIAKMHGFSQRNPRLRLVDPAPQEDYSAAVCLTQPWDLGAVADLHRHALVVGFLMLDTIAWDVLYIPGAPALGNVWRFIARHADGLLYISQFTRERFASRFPVAAGVAERVTHLSFSQEEHVDPAVLGAPVADYILIFGNNMDHKDVRPTTELLLDAFPFNRFVVFGAAEASRKNVTAIPSGELEGRQLHQLVANARVIVYPSFYEGFGLPVVEGLAYGRPVVVRRSPLWGEIAGWSNLPGELVEFDDPPSLVETVGRLLAGLPNQALPSGVALNGASPATWKDCASRVIELLNDCISSADGERWSEREEALQLAGL